MTTTLTIEEARAAYQATLETWLIACGQRKRGLITKDELEAADANVELASAHYMAALKAEHWQTSNLSDN